MAAIESNGVWLKVVTGALFALILGLLADNGRTILRHEGFISAWDAKLGEVERTLERLEKKVDRLGGVK